MKRVLYIAWEDVSFRKKITCADLMMTLNGQKFMGPVSTLAFVGEQAHLGLSWIARMNSEGNWEMISGVSALEVVIKVNVRAAMLSLDWQDHFLIQKPDSENSIRIYPTQISIPRSRYDRVSARRKFKHEAVRPCFGTSERNIAFTPFQ